MAARSRADEQDEFGPCKVVILAGGFGTRLAEQTDELPKPMVQVGGKPILWHILKIYSHFGFNDFLVAGGYKCNIIKRFFLEYRDQMSDLIVDFVSDKIERIDGSIEPWRVAIIDTGTDTMTGGRIRRLAHHIGQQTFMMTYGDGVADVNLTNLYRFHRRHGKLATFTAVRRPAQFGVPTLRGDQVIQFDEKQQDENDWISGGFFVLEPDVMNYIEGDETNFELQSMPHLANDGQLMAYRHDGFWQPMDTLRDVRTLNLLWSQHRAPWRIWNSSSSRTPSKHT
jgi:glucose-1-phosphate cytidylyltransferase